MTGSPSSRSSAIAPVRLFSRTSSSSRAADLFDGSPAGRRGEAGQETGKRVCAPPGEACDDSRKAEGFPQAEPQYC
ncbi:unnamed protein product [Pleuronectes platessa]|uniref:Uncharacterized protein n=1 Tax=Pleuronectes platessa TaxID=8262 RepID=A0A9N7ZBX4_PLEPL|nr:unnamed protein product [Pleuronectes platessa]